MSHVPAPRSVYFPLADCPGLGIFCVPKRPSRGGLRSIIIAAYLPAYRLINYFAILSRLSARLLIGQVLEKFKALNVDVMGAFGQSDCSTSYTVPSGLYCDLLTPSFPLTDRPGFGVFRISEHSHHGGFRPI